jgi:hypothetical protein
MADPARVKLPIEWHCPDNLISRYANNMVVQHIGQTFAISFFEALPPLILGAPEEQLAQLERLGSVRAECVARIIVDVSAMPRFIKALQENLDKFRAISSEPPNEEEVMA